MVDQGARNLLAVTWGIIVNHRQTARRVTQKIKGVLGAAGPAKTINYSPREAPALTPVPEVPPANPTSGMTVPPGARVISIPAPAPAG